MVTAIVTIIMFLVMVSLHEFGHFIVAKSLNFKILEYAIGFGPAIFKKQKGETLYAVRAIPLGGFCKFDGEESESEDPRAFNNQAVWKRMLVVLAGGIFNIILGFIIFIALVSLNSPAATNVIETIVPHSYIEDAGIMPGDKIVKINGHRISFYEDITLYKQDMGKEDKINVTVKRNDELLDFEIMLSEQIVNIKYTDADIEYTSAINGFSTTEHIPYSDRTPKNEELLGTEQSSTNYLIGFTPVMEEITIFNVWGQAWNQTRFVVKLVYQSLWGLVTGRVGVDQMSGPVGIVSEVNSAVNQGSYSWLYVMNLVALLTINLGVFNLLPLPALDGGRLLFMIIELIRRKPIPPEKEGMVHAIGMLLLFALIIFISFNDIARLFGR